MGRGYRVSTRSCDGGALRAMQSQLGLSQKELLDLISQWRLRHQVAVNVTRDDLRRARRGERLSIQKLDAIESTIRTECRRCNVAFEPVGVEPAVVGKALLADASKILRSYTSITVRSWPTH